MFKLLLGKLPDKAQLIAWSEGPEFKLQVTGIAKSIAEIGEQLAWLGSALRSSPYEVGVAFCTPFISEMGVEESSSHMASGSPTPRYFCNISFDLDFNAEDYESPNGQCWHHLFRNPLVVKGYPIPRRSSPNLGLWNPLSTPFIEQVPNEKATTKPRRNQHSCESLDENLVVKSINLLSLSQSCHYISFGIVS